MTFYRAKMKPIGVIVFQALADVMSSPDEQPQGQFWLPSILLATTTPPNIMHRRRSMKRDENK